MKSDKALVVVDVQKDFCPGGSLAVSEGDTVVPVMNKYVREFQGRGRPVFFSRDWHPEVTAHFKEHGGSWPAHCVQGKDGAAFHPGLEIPKEAVIVSKGTDPQREGYSVFSARDDKGTDFESLLRRTLQYKPKEQRAEKYIEVTGW